MHEGIVSLPTLPFFKYIGTTIDRHGKANKEEEAAWHEPGPDGES